MRQKLIGVAVAMAATGLVPGAAAAETAPEAAIAVGLESVALPTGDALAVDAEGMLVSDGTGPGYALTRSVDGDRIAVPLDTIDKVASGGLELGSFNVDDPGEEPEEPAEPGTEVTIESKWLDGSAPDVLGVSAVNVATGERGGPYYFDGGTGTLDLPPGRYQLLAMLHDDFESEDYDSLFAIQEIRVGARPSTVVVDGTRAEPVGFDLDREVVAEAFIFEAFSYEPDTEDGAWIALWAFPGGDVYAVPTGRLTGGRDVGFTIRAGYSSPADATEAYSYNLFRTELGGIPCDMVETVHDEDLAAVESEYQALGTKSSFSRMDMAVHPVYEPWAFTGTGEIALPSERTEFYTADEDLYWEQRGVFPYGRIGDASDWAYRDAGVLEAGETATAVWNDAPISVGLENLGQDFPPAMFYRWDEYEGVFFGPWMFSTASGDEAVQGEFYDGAMTLSNNGTLIASGDDMGLAVESAALRPGRLTVTADFERGVDWSLLGTRSTAAWDFAYDPAADPVLPVSVVEFSTPGLENGYAEAGTTQEFALEFVQQPGGDDQACAAMTFEISFDDGATWTAVPIRLVGDTADASVELPAEAAFGSVRFTAADEAGNTVMHETIRSFGIR
ncbi:hypothetical protein [Glycomyces rhizosphaerae]|uniref:Carboxypeptidase regulatory-like domain-containing protein n=1 Tax=Glycomyces rhizosphaerae TaxID=2054422 RepID=A0ABV7PXY2_9ACTN